MAGLSIISTLIARILLGAFWLLALGAYNNFSWPFDFGLVACVAVVFVYLHIVRDLPRGWSGSGALHWRPVPLVALTLLCAIVFAMTLAEVMVFLLDNPARMDPGLGAQATNPAPVVGALTIVIAVTLAPVVEEVAVRLWLQGLLGQYVGRLSAVLVAAAAFAFVHGDAFAWHFVTGCVYGGIFAVTACLWHAVLAHALHNVVIALLNQFAVDYLLGLGGTTLGQGAMGFGGLALLGWVLWLFWMGRLAAQPIKRSGTEEVR